MIKGFPIDFLRQAFVQTLYKEHLKNTDYVGGDDQLSLVSFYEQLKSEEEVQRFTDTIRDITEQENRMNLIANGIILAPSNPTITNLYQNTIIPMDYGVSFRANILNRDILLESINNLIDELKGKKVDIAQLKCKDDYNRTIYKPFVVGTIGDYGDKMYLVEGDYLDCELSEINDELYDMEQEGVQILLHKGSWVYCKEGTKIIVAYLNNDLEWQKIVSSSAIKYQIEESDFYFEDYYLGETPMNGTIRFVSQRGFSHVPDNIEFEDIYVWLADEQDHSDSRKAHILSYNAQILNGKLVIDVVVTFGSNEGFDLETLTAQVDEMSCYFKEEPYGIIFPPEHESFEKYKLSLSFESLKCDEPYNLNSKEFVNISFGGSATLVNNSVRLGNDLVKLSLHRNKIIASPNIDLSSSATYWVEPLELPASTNANKQVNQLMSNFFKQNTHNDSIANVLEYTFIADSNNELLNSFFKFARYGTMGITQYDISPNMIFDIVEFWSSWGVVEKNSVIAKINESVDIENTESDTLTLSVSFQIQGENN